MKTKHPLEERFPHVRFTDPETCIIGNDVKIGINVFLGEHVTIGDDVEIREHSAIEDSVTIEQGSTLGRCVHVCSGSKIGRNAVALESALIGENVVLGTGVHLYEGALIGNNVTLADFSVIGFRTEIGKGSNLCSRIELGSRVCLAENVIKVCCIKSACGYTCVPQITKDGEQYIQLDCFTRKRSEWEVYFLDNPKELSDGSPEWYILRTSLLKTSLPIARIWHEGDDLLASFLMARLWLDLNTTTVTP